MDKDILLSILWVLVGWNAALSMWVFHHHRRCHKEPEEKLNKVVTETARLTKEIGSNTEPDSILGRLHKHSSKITAASTNISSMKKQLNIYDDPVE